MQDQSNQDAGNGENQDQGNRTQAEGKSKSNPKIGGENYEVTVCEKNRLHVEGSWRSFRHDLKIPRSTKRIDKKRIKKRLAKALDLLRESLRKDAQD